MAIFAGWRWWKSRTYVSSMAALLFTNSHRLRLTKRRSSVKLRAKERNTIHTTIEKFKREQLIVDYLNRGVSVAEIAARFGVGEKRMRAIVREILARRMPHPPEEFVAIQVSRLNEALLVAYSAMSGPNLKAVDRVVKIVRELDRYHGFAATAPPDAGERSSSRPRPAIAFPAPAWVCRPDFAHRNLLKRWILSAPGAAPAAEQALPAPARRPAPSPGAAAAAPPPRAILPAVPQEPPTPPASERAGRPGNSAATC